jgi:hypothetical protein
MLERGDLLQVHSGKAKVWEPSLSAVYCGSPSTFVAY